MLNESMLQINIMISNYCLINTIPFFSGGDWVFLYSQLTQEHFLFTCHNLSCHIIPMPFVGLWKWILSLPHCSICNIMLVIFLENFSVIIYECFHLSWNLKKKKFLLHWKSEFKNVVTAIVKCIIASLLLPAFCSSPFSCPWLDFQLHSMLRKLCAPQLCSVTF